jgi:predicted RNase H-like HicB family nuclease
MGASGMSPSQRDSRTATPVKWTGWFAGSPDGIIDEPESSVSGRLDRQARPPMERIVNSHIEKLPEGVFLATSDEIPGLVAQGHTVTETLEIARDVAKKLLEVQGADDREPALKATADSFDYPLVVSG